MFNNKKPGEEDFVQVGRSILREPDLEIQVQYKGEIFTMRYPTPHIQAAIETEIARRLGGFARSSYAPEHVQSVTACVTVDFSFIPEKCPAWFRGPWNCYDEELIGTLYQGYWTFRGKFLEKLRSGGFEKGSG